MSKLTIHVLLRRCFQAQRGKSGPFIAAEGLSPGQPKLLNYLSRHGGCLQKDLAMNCDIEPATVSKVLTGMEEAGLIERKACSQDKRAIRVRLTEKGAQAEERMKKQFARLEEQELAGFSPEEADELAGYLVRVYRNLTGKDPE